MTYHGRSFLAFTALFAAAAIPPADAAVTRTPFQQYVYGNCGVGDCTISFPTVATNYRIELNNVSCYVSGNADVELDYLQLSVIKGTATAVVFTLPMQEEGGGSSGFSYGANTYTSVFAAAGYHFKAVARPLSGKLIMLACNLGGEKVKLS